MTRSLKAPIPNLFIRSILDNPVFNDLDGELLVGNSAPGATFSQCTDGIMREDGEPNFAFWVFDYFKYPELPYSERILGVSAEAQRAAPGRVKFLWPQTFFNSRMLRDYVEAQIEQGFEGVMVRKPDGPYKYGRATFKEGFLTKVKPFEDAEATVIGFEEAMTNNNAATTNALGRTERSSHKANLVGKDTLGALVCMNDILWPGQTFNIGTGFTDADRTHIWARRPAYLNRNVKFKYQKIGTQDKPRIPSFIGFRDIRDL
jgi:DNA ligase-1